MPPRFALLCLFASLLTPACQLKGSSGGYDATPGVTNPSGATAPNSTTSPAGATTAAASDSGTLVQSPRYIGRLASGGNLLTWPGNAVEAGFNGTTGSATFQNVAGTNFVGVSVDGGSVTSVAVSTTTASVPFSAAAQGNHVVRFTKLNEPELGTLSFTSITVADGKVIPYTAPNRRIEMIGDSITVGYGVLATAPCTNTAATEDNTKAWGWLAGNQLKADVSNIAWSGRGLYRNGVDVDSNDLMPNLWVRAQATDTTPTYTFPPASIPQAVVIDLGTNDYTYVSYDANGNQIIARSTLDQTAFTNAYVTFVQQIRSAYPSSLIVLATSPMLSDNYPSTSDAQWTSLQTALQSVVTQTGDANVTTLSIPTQDTNITGCDGHPDPAEQQSMATMLVTLLQQKLGWQ